MGETRHATSDSHQNASDAKRSPHDRHAGHSVAMFRDKFWLSLTLTVPTVVWSNDVQHWLGYRAPVFPGEPSRKPVARSPPLLLYSLTPLSA